MSLSWSEIRELYLGACRKLAEAEAEWSIHLTEGYRQVAGRLDVPELRMPEAHFTVTPILPGGSDWPDYFDMTGEADVYAIASLHNSTDGILMQPEPGGMSGRSRYLEPTDDATTRPRPPAGTPQWWTREGARIYLRDRPERDTRFEVRFHIQVPEVNEGLLNDHPVTPQQYDRAIAQAAAASFYELHPDANKEMGEGQPLASAFYSGGAETALSRKDPRAIEDRTSRAVIRVAGYRPEPRSRR